MIHICVSKPMSVIVLANEKGAAEVISTTGWDENDYKRALKVLEDSFKDDGADYVVEYNDNLVILSNPVVDN